MGRLSDVVKSAWHLLVGAPWPHDSLDRRGPFAVPLEPLGPWYYDMGRAIERGDYARFDEAGIPRLRLPRGVGVVYHTSRIASFSLAHATRYVQRGDEQDREAALRGARWLVERQVREGEHAGAFPLLFDWDVQKAPWVSALTQGMALSATARAYLLTADETFAAAARRGLTPFQRSCADGGVRSRFHGTDDPWYEEFPTTTGGCHILNGFIHGLWGLRDAGLLWTESSAADLYEAGLDALARHAGAFDLGYWSCYNCPDHDPPRVASMYYHHEHRHMMRILFSLAGQEVFRDLADRWDACARRFGCRVKALTAKLGDR